MNTKAPKIPSHVKEHPDKKTKKQTSGNLYEDIKEIMKMEKKIFG